MIDAQESSDQHRMRVGLIVLVAGILLVLWAGGSWAYRHQPDPELESTLMTEQTSVPPAQAAGAMRWFLIVSLVIVMVALFGSYVLLRMSRQYRAKAAHQRASPTKYEDAWSMHKVPDDDVPS